MWAETAVQILRHCSALCFSSCIRLRSAASLSEIFWPWTERACSLASIARRCSSRSEVVFEIISLNSFRKLAVIADVRLYENQNCDG